MGQSNLFILHDTRIQPDRDFREIARRVRALAPDIHASVATEKSGRTRARWTQLVRPTLFVEMNPLPGWRSWRGAVARHNLWGKMETYRYLERHGLPVPPWREVVPDIGLDPAEWGPWVVVKPDHGGRGIDIEGVTTSELRYRAAAELPAGHLGRKSPLLAQRYVDTEDAPAFYRVTTCFGEPLFAVHYYTPQRWVSDRRPPAIVVERYLARLTDERDVLDLARRVHATLPDVPTIGCDFMRDRRTGRLWIAEINQGAVWALSSPSGMRLQAKRGLDLYTQFGALDRAAEAMVRATRRLAH